MDSALCALTDQVKNAVAHKRALRIRGGGSKDFYGRTLAADLAAELLDTRPLTGVSSYEPSELVVTVRAGTPLRELEALLAGAGQCLAFEPPHFAGTGDILAASVATVGGMVAAGLSGPSRASVGPLRDYLLGVTLLNGRAELLTFGGQVMKNVAGYDVSRLMAGALGTLGVLVEVSLKVLPVAPAECTLVFDLDEAAALGQLNRWAGLPLPINASCWQRDAQGSRLLVRLRGAQAAVAAARTRMGGEALDDGAAAFWHRLREQTAAFFTPGPNEVLWRLSLPDTAPCLNLGTSLIEWGGAQRWLKRPASDAQALRAAAHAAGGHATLFRGTPGMDPVFTAPVAPLMRIHRNLKAEFDPAGVFNPGRLLPLA